jgi:D-inositol-3-phosphate glycosyltransferase
MSGFLLPQGPARLVDQNTVNIASMTDSTSLVNDRGEGHSSSASREDTAGIRVGLLTGGVDKPYCFGLAKALLSKGVRMDFIGSDEVDHPDFHTSPLLNFLNLRGDQSQDASLAKKLWRVLVYYGKLIKYASANQPQVFHILWNNKFETFDRTLLMLYYKAFGKKIVLTVHNVNARRRDTNDSFLNRLTLKIQYRLSDHMFVHTEKMKEELLSDFGANERAVSVIPFGINNLAPQTDLTPTEAKRRLGIEEGSKVLLFFGHIVPYKGLDFLVEAFKRLSTTDGRYRLIIAGKVNGSAEKHLEGIQRTIEGAGLRERVLQKIEYIPDEETELYFKAADVCVLPYTQVFQSGVLFLGYSFGRPIIASRVGSFSGDVVEGRTGFLCNPRDSNDLAHTICKYFRSELYKELDQHQQDIRKFAGERNSWKIVGDTTVTVYSELSAVGEHMTERSTTIV